MQNEPGVNASLVQIYMKIFTGSKPDSVRVCATALECAFNRLLRRQRAYVGSGVFLFPRSTSRN
jgi:hypothetical protein